MLANATRVERLGTEARFVFAAVPVVTSELARLCAAETECCPFLEFRLDIVAGAVVLTVDGPDDAAGLFTALVETREVVTSTQR